MVSGVSAAHREMCVLAATTGTCPWGSVVAISCAWSCLSLLLLPDLAAQKIQQRFLYPRTKYHIPDKNLLFQTCFSALSCSRNVDPLCNCCDFFVGSRFVIAFQAGINLCPNHLSFRAHRRNSSVPPGRQEQLAAWHRYRSPPMARVGRSCSQWKRSRNRAGGSPVCLRR